VTEAHYYQAFCLYFATVRESYRYTPLSEKDAPSSSQGRTRLVDETLFAHEAI